MLEAPRAALEIEIVATDRDLDLVARMHAACFDPPWDLDAVTEVLAMPGAFGLIASGAARGATVGFVLCRVVHDVGELLSIGIVPAYRRRGLGRKLLGIALAESTARGARSMVLEVAEDNGPARALYRQAGFVTVARWPGYYRRATGAAAAETMRYGPAD